MILSCPECPKTYDVPSSALPPGGREVECSSCGAVWFERGMMAQAVNAGAAAADLAMPVWDEVIDAEFKAVGATEPRPAPEPAADDAAPAPSPARDQQTALTVAYGVSAAQSTPRHDPSGEEAAKEAARLAALAVSDVLRRLRDSALAMAGFALGTAHHVLARLRGRPAPERPATPGDAAANATRARMRAKAVNALTPARMVGWVAWTVVAGLIVFAVALKGDVVQRVFPPSAKLYSLMGPPPAADGLTVTGGLDAYAVSSQGPAVMVSGVVANRGRADAVPLVTMTIETPDGPVSQAVSLPQVPLPPGGERPFAVRALVPPGASGVSVDVAAGKTSRKGFALQERGGWATGGNGHAGPPQLGGAPGTAPR